jgi:hypothetical protein
MPLPGAARRQVKSTWPELGLVLLWYTWLNTEALSVPLDPVPPIALPAVHARFDAGIFVVPLGGVKSAALALTLIRTELPAVSAALLKVTVKGLGVPVVGELTSVTKNVNEVGTVTVTVSAWARLIAEQQNRARMLAIHHAICFTSCFPPKLAPMAGAER